MCLRDLSSVLGQNTDFVPMFQMYINAMVKQGQAANQMWQSVLVRIQESFTQDRMQQQMSGLKGTEGLAVETRQDETDATCS